MGRVLIACEESQTVCKAFRALGYEAYSCDIQECSGGHPEWHIQGDAIDALYSRKWDLVIAHPTCTYLSNSGVCHIHTDASRLEKLVSAIEFFSEFQEYGINNRIAIENPIPHKYARDGFFFDLDTKTFASDYSTNIKRVHGIKMYSQTFQPYHFGHAEQKQTCLWLYNIPPLIRTSDLKKETLSKPNSERQRLHWASGPDRQKIRSKTFQGIADAMAEQWGKLI